MNAIKFSDVLMRHTYLFIVTVSASTTSVYTLKILYYVHHCVVLHCYGVAV